MSNYKEIEGCREVKLFISRRKNWALGSLMELVAVVGSLSIRITNFQVTGNFERSYHVTKTLVPPECNHVKAT